MTPNGYALLGLTALVGALIAIVTFALLRFADAARNTRRLRSDRGELALMSAALQEAVTKLKAQERATAARAEASERLSEEIIASLTAGLLVSGLDGEIRILNPAGRRMLGISDTASADEIRTALADLALGDVLRESFTTNSPITRRTIALREPRQGVSQLGVTVSPLSDTQSRVYGAICLFTDLTAVKDLEEQLRLKESLATVGELTAGIAHEFRNGLATIHGYSKLFDLKALPEAYRKYVEGIRAETESLSQVVTNFLSFARPAELALSRVDVKGICERAADEIRADVTTLGGTVAVRGDFGIVDGDEVLLRQAFSNLLRNALEACITAHATPDIAILAETDVAQKLQRIAVNDNGGGIPVQLRERIFRPFFTSKRNGTGLGLALVQKIIVFHNGRIVATASSSGGASLQITLPITG
jgi:signal transduction histidine kinase